MSISPDQYGRRCGDRAKHREVSHAFVCGVDAPDPIRPRHDVEAAGLTEVEQHRPGMMEQGQDPERAVSLGPLN